MNINNLVIAVWGSKKKKEKKDSLQSYQGSLELFHH